MKIKLWLILITSVVFSSSAFSQEDKREHLKCYVQLEDESRVVHHFVNSGKENKEFIEGLTARTVFMADGVTEKKIETIYECVDIKISFKNKDAVTLEKNTPF